MFSQSWFKIAFCFSAPSEGTYSHPQPVNPSFQPHLYHGCYGDVMRMDTPGASCNTDRLIHCGIRGSELFAEMDLALMMKYQTMIKTVGQKQCVDPALIAAIISRETHAGSVLQDGWDHQGLKFGLMQLDKHTHHPTGAWDSQEHLTQAVKILTDTIKTIQRKFPTWSMSQHLKGGLYAYRSGIDALVTPTDVENDYTNDILARCKFYRRHGF
ncbi:lysozyme g-like protein 2 [Monodelphis domestica]|uniref:lysozyme g-like protein 2 n=1 Tax=Monodelphis domestica TaxID=13616 RepID=UPI0024E1CCA0|nr:lysozyme g-like protein 2 [Monodelphis domestica]